MRCAKIQTGGNSFTEIPPYPPPTQGVGVGYRGGVGLLRVDFRETIPACLNFGDQHIFFLYPKKLSYSSRNAYIRKMRARGLGKPTCLLKNLKNA